MLTVPRSSLPADIREGDAVTAFAGCRYAIDAGASEQQHKQLFAF